MNIINQLKLNCENEQFCLDKAKELYEEYKNKKNIEYNLLKTIIYNLNFFNIKYEKHVIFYTKDPLYVIDSNLNTHNVFLKSIISLCKYLANLNIQVSIYCLCNQNSIWSTSISNPRIFPYNTLYSLRDDNASIILFGKESLKSLDVPRLVSPNIIYICNEEINEKIEYFDIIKKVIFTNDNYRCLFNKNKIIENINYKFINVNNDIKLEKKKNIILCFTNDYNELIKTSLDEKGYFSNYKVIICENEIDIIKRLRKSVICLYDKDIYNFENIIIMNKCIPICPYDNYITNISNLKEGIIEALNKTISFIQNVDYNYLFEDDMNDILKFI